MPVVLALVGCQESFQPLKENDQYYFSMYGYLDASTDTQWVRISPAREQLRMQTVTPEMRVTLEEMESGNSVVMRDSLFKQNNGFNYLNFWTTMDIIPAHKYRITAERPGGGTSSVTVTIPEDFPQPQLGYAQMGCSATVHVQGVERLADIQSVWKLQINSSGYKRTDIFRFSYRSKAYGRAGSYSATTDPIRERERLGDYIKAPAGDISLTGRYLWVASGGLGWVEELDSLDNPTYTLPEGLSNVEKGVGYVVGIVSKKVSYEKCSFY